MITVWMAVYNEEKHLAETINSVLAQSFRDFQFVISDNHSTDKSAEIIDLFAKKDPRIIRVKPEKHCHSNQHAEFIYENILPRFSNKYSIHIGGHDLWDPLYLQILFQMAENYPDSSIVYGQGYDMAYEDNKIIGKFDDHIVSSEIIKPIIPHLLLLGLRVNIVFFGLVREDIRKQCILRHHCVGSDHLFITDMALMGKILFEPSAKFYLRRSKDHDNLSAYGKRHLSQNNSNSYNDFLKQLEWVNYLINKAINLSSNPDLYSHPKIKSMLTISLLYGYIIRYLPNLNVFDTDGIQNFFNRPELLHLFEANGEIQKYLEQLIVDNLSATNSYVD